MSDHQSELRTLRARLAALRGRLDARGPSGKRASPFRVGRVFAETSLPAAAGLVYATRPVDVFPPAAEGGAATFVEHDDRVLYARVVGSPPAAGDYLLAAGVDYRWQAERRGASGNALPGCTCTGIPSTLYYDFNYAPFGTGPWPYGTLTWQPQPSDTTAYAFAGTNPGFWSDVTGTTDPLTSDFTYGRCFLYCSSGQYYLWFCVTPGNPHYPSQFGLATYTSVTCSPFNLGGTSLYSYGGYTYPANVNAAGLMWH